MDDWRYATFSKIMFLSHLQSTKKNLYLNQRHTKRFNAVRWRYEWQGGGIGRRLATDFTHCATQWQIKDIERHSESFTSVEVHRYVHPHREPMWSLSKISRLSYSHINIYIYLYYAKIFNKYYKYIFIKSCNVNV